MCVGVIINFCTNELCFLEVLLKECSKFSSDIVVSYTDQLYNGEVEDLSFISLYRQQFPHVKFVKYAIDLMMSPQNMKGVIYRPLAYWHNLARFTASSALDPSTEWVFVIDADEIPDGDQVKYFLDTRLFDQEKSYKIATYWYFKLPVYQSQVFEDSILLIHKKHLTEDNIFGDMERDHLIAHSKTNLQRMVMGLNKLPMFHHFSWVRSYDGIRKKVSSWAHKFELGMTTEQVLDRIYSNEGINDIIHNYRYNQVDNIFDIVLTKK